jgi:hypothetical protein
MDPTVSWFKDPSPVVSGYLVYWSYNGAAIPPFAVPQSAQSDAGGYSLDFGSSNPTITVQPGDTIGAAVASVSQKFNLQSPQIVATPPTVTEPVPALGGPTAVTLAP